MIYGWACCHLSATLDRRCPHPGPMLLPRWRLPADSHRPRSPRDHFNIELCCDTRVANPCPSWNCNRCLGKGVHVKFQLSFRKRLRRSTHRHLIDTHIHTRVDLCGVAFIRPDGSAPFESVRPRKTILEAGPDVPMAQVASRPPYPVCRPYSSINLDAARDNHACLSGHGSSSLHWRTSWTRLWLMRQSTICLFCERIHPASFRS